MKKIHNLLKILTKKEKLSLFIVFVLSLIVVAIELLTLASIPILFSQLLEYKTDKEFLDKIIEWITFNSENNFLFTIYIIVIIFFLRSIFLYLVKILEFIILKRIRLRLSFLLIKNFLSSNILKIRSETPATKLWKMEIINNLGGVIENLLTFIKSIFLITVIILFSISYAGSQIIFLFFAMLLLASIFFYFFSSFIKKTGAKADLANKNKINVLQNIMNGIKDIFIFNKFSFFKNKFKNFIIESERNSQKNIIITNIPTQFLEFIGICFICLFAVKLDNSGLAEEKIISIISVLAYAGLRLVGALKLSIIQFNSYKTNSFVIGTILEELKTKKNDNFNSDIVYRTANKSNNLIEIKDLSFKYKENQLLFENLNQTFEKDKFYAIFGPSGSGKSTFLDLLLGFHKTGINQININCSREEVGYVPQESYLSNGTIKENIAFGIDEDEIDIEQIYSCLKMAKIYDFVNSLPDKIESNLLIFGSNISVGQKQRIGIARTLYRNPKIILMDEPTSALDTKTEQELINTLKDLKKDRLIIMTTHKKNFIEKFDTILNLKNKTLI